MDEKIGEKIEAIKKRLNSLEEGLTEEEKALARIELDALVTGINAEIEAYLVKMKTIEIKQS